MKISISDFRQLLTSVLIKAGHHESHAQIIADVLLYAELRDNNQGAIKLIAGALNPSNQEANTKLIFESPVSAKIDGRGLIGMVVVYDAVEIAVQKCKATGISIVGCSGYASATGALGYWARKISDAGFIGIVMSQCNEMVAPHGSYEAIFGTNPIAISVPTTPRAQVLDMATSAAAFYGIKLAEKNGESIPNNIAYDQEGNATTNPTAALSGAIRSFDRSYKGSHLALMVELLAGALTGASMENKSEAKNWGSLVLAIDPVILGDKEQFIANANAMCDRVKNAKKLPDYHKEIYLPGERGDVIENARLQAGFLEVADQILSDLNNLLTK